VVPASVALFATACASVPRAPVEVVGRSADLSAMSGEWIGEYSSAATGRAGSIFFTLAGGEEGARGEVWMIDQDDREVRLPFEARAARPLELLTIRFVRVEDGLVSGRLDPYIDPATGCELLTTFRGRLEDGTISGTFTTVNRVSGQEMSGLWRAERRRTLAEEERR
jgi:hypothetical protein